MVLDTWLMHEQVHLHRGERTGVPVVVAVPSTRLGPAVGGCRIREYDAWQDALDDALRLSSAMTDKCALAGLPFGGGKTVVALPRGTARADRRQLLLDVGDVVDALGGRYTTGPDIGSDEVAMGVIGSRTRHVVCRPSSDGGSGDSSSATARGVMAALRTACREAFGGEDLAGRRVALLGLGRVGTELLRLLDHAGADIVAGDVDASRRETAISGSARWSSPPELLEVDADVLIPAALGGVLTAALVRRLRCRVVVGPANNQLDRASTADLLSGRGIVWVPDVVASAGGVVYATARELLGEDRTAALARVDGIVDTTADVLDRARRCGISSAAAAAQLVGEHLAEGSSTW